VCCAPQVLLEMKQLLLQFQRRSEGPAIRQMLQFLKTRGYQQQFEMLEQELRDCLMQLSGILNIAYFTSQVGAAAAAAVAAAPAAVARPHIFHSG
jgi:hypothetical protein